MSEAPETSGEQVHTPEFYVDSEVLFLFSSEREFGDSINVLDDIFLPSPLAENPDFQEWISRLESGTRPVFYLSPREGELPKFVTSARLNSGTVGEFLQTYLDIFLPTLDEEYSSDDEGEDLEGPPLGGATATGTELNLGAVSLDSTVPNWYSGGSQHIGTGGPGDDPKVATYADSTTFQEFRFSFRSPGPVFFDVPAGLSPQPVDVVVLDTVPRIGDIKAAVSKLGNRNHPLKSLLTDSGGNLITTFSAAPNRRAGKLTITYEGDLPTPLQLVNIPSVRLPYPNDCAPLNGHDYPMADHGLFIAGIIHLIAPDANIHLIQALDDYGVGSLSSILAALDYAKQQKQANVPLIINASFTLTYPSDPQHCKTMQDPALANLLQTAAFIALQEKFLEDAFYVTSDPNRFIVAAAGNDSARPSNAGAGLKARYPAVAVDVLGVGALDALDNPAPYSNVSDFPPVSGFVTFGGTSAKPMLGIYVGNFPSGQPNTEICAWWMGTSFATAIVTGTIAHRARSFMADISINRTLYEAAINVANEILGVVGSSENGLLVTQG